MTTRHAGPKFIIFCRFVTRQELEGVGLSHLVGSSLLRAYMHGYFIHNKLWQKAKSIAAPVDYATVRKERIQSKLEAERAQRITLKRRLPKVRIPHLAAWG
jgi:ribosome biogenesis protein ENP2